MRRPDPRPWNLVPSTLLLAAACGPPEIPVEDDGADDITDDVTDDSASDDLPNDLPGECSVDGECPPGYYCWVDVCLPESSSEYGDGSPDDDDGPSYECYVDDDCPPAHECLSFFCSPKPVVMTELVECGGPGLVEIPLPGLGSVLGLQLADVDGDDDDELVALRPDGIAVVQDDDSILHTPWPMPPSIPLHQLALLALDGDGAIDLVAFPENFGSAIVMLGDGTGNFISLGEMADVPLVDRLVGFDGDLDGIDGLLALRPNIERVVQFSELTSLSDEQMLLSAPGASDLDILRLDSRVAPNVLIGMGCGQASIQTGQGLEVLELISAPGLGGPGLCEWHPVAFVVGPDQPLLVHSQDDANVLRRWDLVDNSAYQLELPIGPISSTRANLDGTGDFLLLTAVGEGRMIWDWSNEGPACVAPLPFFGLTQFAVGDLDGNGTQDVATLDDFGVLRLWSVP